MGGLARDFGPKRDMAKADAAVAKATTGDRIEESRLQVEEARLRNEERRLHNERLALENRRLAASVGIDELKRQLIEQAVRRGELDIADAIEVLDAGDVQAFAELALRPLELQERSEPDPDA